MFESITSRLPDTRVNWNGSRDNMLPNTLSLGFDLKDKPTTASELIGRFSIRLACSAGAACHTTPSNAKPQEKMNQNVTTEISKVLKAMKIDHKFARTTLRLSVGRFTSMEEVEQAASVVSQAVLNGKCVF